MRRVFATLVILLLAVPVYAQFRWFRRSPTVKHTLTVQSGTGSGQYTKGQAITIKASPYSDPTYRFAAWIQTDNKTLKIWPKPPVANVNSATTVLTMPDNDIIVQATYVK